MCPWPVWLSWLEHHPVHEKFGGLIPRQGTHLGCGFSPQSARVWEATYQCFFLSFLPFFLCLCFQPPPLTKINKHIFKNLK